MATAGGLQAVDCLILEFVPAWIATVSRANATPIVQERLRYFTLFSIRDVYAAVAREAGLPAASSRQIEELGDLTAFDASIQRLAERQQAIEDSQDKARQAWRNLDARVRRLEEAAVEGKLSVRQRGMVYHLVQTWAEGRATRERVSIGVALRACRSALCTRYKVSRYEDIERQYYDVCVGYIQRQYKKLTGSDLHLPEQGELDL